MQKKFISLLLVVMILMTSITPSYGVDIDAITDNVTEDESNVSENVTLMYLQTKYSW